LFNLFVTLCFFIAVELGLNKFVRLKRVLSSMYVSFHFIFSLACLGRDFVLIFVFSYIN